MNLCSSIITLPINKEKIAKNIDNKFIGHTDFLQKLDKKKFTNMIFFFKKNNCNTTYNSHTSK